MAHLVQYCHFIGSEYKLITFYLFCFVEGTLLGGTIIAIHICCRITNTFFWLIVMKWYSVFEPDGCILCHIFITFRNFASVKIMKKKKIKLTANVIETFYCFLKASSIFNNIHHKHCSHRFGIYLGKFTCLLIKI